jgi:hypothetical protein
MTSPERPSGTDPGHSHFSSKRRNVGGAERKQCLTKLKEGEASGTKLSCHSPVFAMRRGNKASSL